jgi:hypothetical protein
LHGSACFFGLYTSRNKNTSSRRGRTSRRVSFFYFKTLVYFMVEGIAGYVLPRLDNLVYIKVEEGDHFGHSDIVQDQKFLEF